MADLFTSLTSASRALQAQQLGLDVTGQNIANVNTTGYSRRTTDMSPIAPDSPGTAGRGVEVTGIRALRDRLLEVRLAQEASAQKREQATADALSVVVAAVGESGKSIDASLNTFFASFATLAEDPTSSSARQDVVLRGESLATSFRDMAGRLDAARHDADRQVKAAVDDINSLTSRIAALNRSIASAPTQEGSLHARDEQAQLVAQLSELVDIRTLERTEGGVDVSLGSGRPLVVGVTSYAITATPTAPSGLLQLTLGGGNITSAISGGSLGGMLRVRDVTIPGYQSQLDTLAYTTVQQVNALHAAGYDQTGATGNAFFAFSAALGAPPAGAAAALIVDTAVAADPRMVAAGTAALAGDNRTAGAIAALRDARVLDGNTSTLNDGWAQLIYRVGRDAKDAADQADGREQIVSQVNALRDQVSGVSLDEEAMQLLKFQRAYEANAKFFNIIDEALQTLLALGA